MEFVTHFQGIYQLHPNTQGIKAYGHEALLRGVEDGEIVPPLGLFTTAKRDGSLTELDIQSIKLACQTFSTDDPGGLLFVNIFPETLCTPEFSPDFILKLLENLDLAPARIVLEVVEGWRLADMPRVGKILAQLTAEGLRFALDDFGIGVGDLESWLDLRPHIIKIDRSLIRGVAKDPRRQKTLMALEWMTKESEALVIYEGVEYVADAVWIQNHFDTPLCQGFLFGRPAVLKTRNPEPSHFSLPRLALCS